MKQFFLLLALALPLTAAETRTLSWTYHGPQGGQFGGIATNDYLTNITFVVYSSTNVGLPLAQWTKAFEWPATNFLAQGPLGTRWTNSIAVDALPKFFVMQAVDAKGGTGPFSNVDFRSAPPSAGIIEIK